MNGDPPIDNVDPKTEAASVSATVPLKHREPELHAAFEREQAAIDRLRETR